MGRRFGRGVLCPQHPAPLGRSRVGDELAERCAGHLRVPLRDQLRAAHPHRRHTRRVPAQRSIRPTELQCEDAIIAAARAAGWRVHVERTSRSRDGGFLTAIKGDRGWPDLVAVRDGELLIRELKRRPNTVEPDQERWLAELRACGIDADVCWVPEQMDGLMARLVQPRRRRRG